jgi:hypothetical protein
MNNKLTVFRISEEFLIFLTTYYEDTFPANNSPYSFF